MVISPSGPERFAKTIGALHLSMHIVGTLLHDKRGR